MTLPQLLIATVLTAIAIRLYIRREQEIDERLQFRRKIHEADHVPQKVSLKMFAQYLLAIIVTCVTVIMSLERATFAAFAAVIVLCYFSIAGFRSRVLPRRARGATTREFLQLSLLYAAVIAGFGFVLWNATVGYVN